MVFVTFWLYRQLSSADIEHGVTYRIALERFARARHHDGYWEIELGNGGGSYLVDDEDVEAVKSWTWTKVSRGYVGRRTPDSKTGSGDAF